MLIKKIRKFCAATVTTFPPRLNRRPTEKCTPINILGGKKWMMKGVFNNSSYVVINLAWHPLQTVSPQLPVGMSPLSFHSQAVSADHLYS